MVAVQTHPLEFEAFLAQYPDDGRRYELIEGEVIAVLPTGPHEEIAGFLVAEFNLAIRRGGLAYTIPRACLLKPQAPRSGYQPDVAVCDRRQLRQEPLWKTASVIESGATVPLVVEVVSTNWRDDYGHKLIEYEAMGIQEYWLVDYRALGGVRYIGTPKQPTITIANLVEGEYQLQQFRRGD
ncbi:MAG: Uma2 family endonuclease, partial [Phormidium sp. SL48-SHIP]